MDACVLIPYTTWDIVLTVCERTGTVPIWSNLIELEVRRNLFRLLRENGMESKTAKGVVESRIRNSNLAFPFSKHDLTSQDTETLWLPGTDEKDYHVAALAIQTQADIILTYNVKHFGQVALARNNISVLTPDQFLTDIFEEKPETVIAAMNEIINRSGRTGQKLTYETICRNLHTQHPTFTKTIANYIAKNHQNPTITLKSIETTHETLPTPPVDRVEYEVEQIGTVSDIDM